MKGMSRRRFVETVSAAWGAAMVGGAIPLTLTKPARAAAASSLAGGAKAFQSAAIDWKRFRGTVLRFDASANPWVSAIRPYLGEFRKLTGINVEINMLGESEFVAKLPIILSSGASVPDAFMVNELGQAISAGWMAPLDDLIGDSKLTDKSWYDIGDFFPSALEFPTVKGTRWAVPISAEVQVIFARKDLVSSAPATFSDFTKVAAAANKSGKVAGVAMRASSDPNESPWPLGGFVFSYGAYYITPDGRPGFDTPEMEEAVARYTELLKLYGPKGVATWGWEQCDPAMQAGDVAMWCDASDFAHGLLDPKTARYAKETVLYPMPVHNGVSRPNVWYWTVGINKNSKHRDAAWLFLQWATSKPICAAMAGVTGTAPRASGWTSEAARRQFGVDASDVLRKALSGADSAPMALAWTNGQWPEIEASVAQGVSGIVAGQTSVKDAIKAMQDTAEKVLKKA